MEKEFVAHLAIEAGEILKSRTGSAIVRAKDGTDIVTDADEASERFIREEILRRYPDHRVLGEEYGSNEAEAEWEWVIDPLDGTVNFARGNSYFSVSIALAYQGTARIGAVYRPLTGELFLAERGGGATLNGHPVHVSTIPRVEESIVILDWSRQQTRQENLARMERILLASHKIRCHGSAALDLCSIAAGQLEGVCPPPSDALGLRRRAAHRRGSGRARDDPEGAERTLAAGSVLATNGRSTRRSRLAARLSGNTTAPPGSGRVAPGQASRVKMLCTWGAKCSMITSRRGLGWA